MLGVTPAAETRGQYMESCYVNSAVKSGHSIVTIMVAAMLPPSS